MLASQNPWNLSESERAFSITLSPFKAHNCDLYARRLVWMSRGTVSSHLILSYQRCYIRILAVTITAPRKPNGSKNQDMLDSSVLFVIISAGVVCFTSYCKMSLIECHCNSRMDTLSFLSSITMESGNDADKLFNSAGVFKAHLVA